MSSQPIIPYTAAEQIDALNRMAPELGTKRNGLPEPRTVQALIAMARSVESVAAEEGMPLRIVEARSLPSPNPLATPLAIARTRNRILLYSVRRGLLLARGGFAIATVLFSVAPLLTMLTAATACLTPLALLAHHALNTEVR